MTTIVAHSVINLGTILLVRIANHHADAFGLPRTWRADPRGKFRVRIVCGRHVDHAERLQRPGCHLVGSVLERRRQAAELHVHAKWRRQRDGQRAMTIEEPATAPRSETDPRDVSRAAPESP
jgi:hypothetical protein